MRKSHPHSDTEYSRRRVSLMPLTPVGEIMRRDVVCVSEDMTEAALIGVLLEHDLTGAPVVDSRGHLVGYVSLSDILRERYENADTGATVRVTTTDPKDLGSAGFHVEMVPPMTTELMSSVSVEVLDTTHIDDAAAIMSARRMNELPVVDKKGHVVGMLHAVDVLRWLSQAQRPASG